jgi:SAM-dependent methyltransferase
MQRDRPVTEDLFGEIFMSYLKGDRTKHYIRRDDGYLNEVDAGRYFTEYAEFPDYEKEILKYVKGKVLDIGCGPGRHSLWLQQSGYDVTAIDISPLAVEVSKLRGVRNCRGMSACSLKFESNSCDTVLLIDNNLGICGTIESVKKMLEDIWNITTKAGIIIGTGIDPTGIEEEAHLKYHELNRQRGRYIGEVKLRFEYKDKVGEWFDLALIEPAKLEELCKQTGWKITKLVKSERGIYGVVLMKHKNAT